MTKKHLLLFFFFCVCSVSTYANFNFNANCVNAYEAIISLRINEARQLIQKEKQHDPKNGIIIMLENYVDFFSLMASDNKNDYERLKDYRSDRLSALEDNSDEKSPYYLYTQAEVYLQWGLLKGRFGDYLSSARDLKKASNLLKENTKKFPDFTPNKKGIALVNVIFGSIPSNMKGITSFLGMTGNAPTGIKQLEALRLELPKSKYELFKDEVIFFLCYINIDVLHNKNSYDKLIGYVADMDSKSLLKSYLQGYVAFKSAHNEEAINFLKSAPASTIYIDMPPIDYLLGNAKLNRLDTDAYVYLNNYLRSYKGINFIKDTYLKLAYFYLLKGDNAKYDYYLKQVRAKGYAVDEKDKQALKEANDAPPDTDLLRARFYFDGGYYNKALAELKDEKVNTFKLLRDKIEFYYRLGRVYDRMEHDNEALQNYQQAINLGKKTSYYYAANAALSIGYIYERKKDYPRAASFYKQAIDMDDHEYKSSIDNEAKDGLKRLGK
ncbi:hypothetical protein GCM10023149_06280 [Mucilaginibacter gynuensis]|uniref:Tetratricopeptide repeat protein n=1 Tax=Mucilaginibacter gynuensis TaxID=1302236 RepID=A0ABP8FUS7_9SPHI